MNGKQARKLRKQVVKTETNYIVGKQPIINESNEKLIGTIGVAKPGMRLEVGVPTKLDDCSRKIYKSLKKDYKC